MSGDTVRQAGTRRLWDEALTGYHWWIDHGRPIRQRFGVTVTRQHHWVWLDNPDTIVSSYVKAEQVPVDQLPGECQRGQR